MAVVGNPYVGFSHKEKLGGNHKRVNRNQKYRIPAGLVRYLLGESGDPLKWDADEESAVQALDSLLEVERGIARMQLVALPEVHYQGAPN